MVKGRCILGETVEAVEAIVETFSGLTAGKKRRYVPGSLVTAAVGLPLDSEVLHWTSLRSKHLDRVFGDEKQGIPAGRIVEMFGPESHGKTSLLLHIFAEVQRAGGLVALADPESSFREDRAIQLGVDPKAILHLQLRERADGKGFEGLEDLFCKIEDLIKVADAVAPGTPLVIGWDTVESTPTRAELDGEFGDDSIAEKARAMSAGLRKLFFETLRGSNATLIAVNQVRTKIGYISYDDSPGGRALKFYASVRVKVVRTGILGVSGIRGVVENRKNKVGPPHRKVGFELYFNKKGFQFKEA